MSITGAVGHPDPLCLLVMFFTPLASVRIPAEPAPFHPVWGVRPGGCPADPFLPVVETLDYRTGSIGPVTDATHADKPLKILVYSDDVNTRSEVILALGRRPHPDLPKAEYVEVATEPVVIQQMDSGVIDLAIFDGEAVPAGGMGISKQMKDEIFRCPPIVVLTGRPQDAWLATWSRADAAVPRPIDPIALGEAVARLLRARIPVAR
jgi:hypothetical protein